MGLLRRKRDNRLQCTSNLMKYVLLQLTKIAVICQKLYINLCQNTSVEGFKAKPITNLQVSDEYWYISLMTKVNPSVLNIFVLTNEELFLVDYLPLSSIPSSPDTPGTTTK